ncbi:MAG: 16S rRNA (cytosine(1402)-N(4))-methyltransferase RsmH [Chloroflexi bacterium]|nr:16S rRNA (cytosine(1402)-N(4))-methyltransferase RsmH [Chloroflexota bacterium]
MHVSVLYNEIITGLQPRAGGRYIDGTVGAGGHAFGILTESAPTGEVLGLDLDPAALGVAANRLREFGSRAHLAQASYLALAQEAHKLGWKSVDGIVLDLGLSSLQLEDANRGFAFKHDGPLDMRFNPAGGLTAGDLVNGASPDELADILFKFGEERNARKIVRAIVAARPIHSTGQLAGVVAAAVKGRREETHPATRTFQALRIAVNEELDTVEQVLPIALKILKPGGRLAVISFHSLEDRIVKTFFHREARDCLCPPDQPVCTCGHRAGLKEITRKPVAPPLEEIARNPRSRSAKLRIVEKL